MRKRLLVGTLALLGLMVGCSNDDDENGGSPSSSHGGSGGKDAGAQGGSGGSEQGGSGGSEQGGSGGGAQGGSGGSAQGGSGGSAQGGSGGSAQGGSGGSAQGGSGGDPSDPFAMEREACFNKVNALRATKGLPPYARWTAAESCSDDEASKDAASGQAHGAFGQCGEMGQNECPGWGASSVEACLESMWAEKDQSGCQGCDACADQYSPNCPGCDFYGSSTGQVCGHYVNMSAKYLSKVACGFSSQGGWIVINFQ